MLFTPLPLSQTVTPSRTPSPLERDVLYGRPLAHHLSWSSFCFLSYIVVSLLLVCDPSVYFVFFLLRVSGICLLQSLPALLRLLYVLLIFSIILYDRTSKASIHFVSS